MRTPKGIDALLSRIMETGGMTEDMEKAVKELKDEFDEREGVLREYGEAYDGEAESYDWRAKPIDDYRERYNELDTKYQDLVRRYNDKFFAPGDAHETDTELDENEVPDSRAEDITIDDLFVDQE